MKAFREMQNLAIDYVIKVGGGLLAQAPHFAAVLATISQESAGSRALIVPGGGPFADAVRDADRRFSLSNTTAHWMAVLAMDQYAHMLASKLPGGVVVNGPDDIGAALEQKRLPVLAPSRWLHGADPLPHSWDVTSDSIAAWVAGSVGAKKLILVKPAGAGSTPVDPYFARALPVDVSSIVVCADRLDNLRAAMRSV